MLKVVQRFGLSTIKNLSDIVEFGNLSSNEKSPPLICANEVYACGITNIILKAYIKQENWQKKMKKRTKV